MEQKWARDCTGLYQTSHYDFHFVPGSLAERDIGQIGALQERCWEKITAFLGVIPPFRLHYFLLDTPELVGKVYGDDEPCNGFAAMPDTVFAVYNDRVKCVGMHEDTHLISYCINRPPSGFLREGLAMFMDETWWDRPNEDWVREYLRDGSYRSPVALLEDETFYSLSDALTYPIAGAFTRYLLARMPVGDYLEKIYRTDRDVPGALARASGMDLTALEADFRRWITEEA